MQDKKTTMAKENGGNIYSIMQCCYASGNIV